MREILFRGKRKNGGFWLFGDLRQWSETRKGIHDYSLMGTSEVEMETVGQFTGLADKNGKKIFEGDIVRCIRTHCDGKEVVGHIIFGECCFSVKTGIDRPAMDLCNDFEVIGNIHDNPELLEVSGDE